jgi:hypothetical protein
MLGPSDRLPGRPFTDAEQSQTDLRVMTSMLAREREIARSWSPDMDGPGITETEGEGTRELLAVPDGRALVAARDVTAVGFFGTLRDGVDHSVLFAHERQIARTFPEYAARGFLSYFDAGFEHGRYGNLILFRTPGVPAAWRANPTHRLAVACAPEHYAHIRLHKGHVRGPFLGDGTIEIEQTLYLEYRGGVTWRAVRSYGARPLTLS